MRALALIWVGVMIALPLTVLLEHGLREGVVRFWAEITNPIALAAVRLTIFAAAAMTLINAAMGTLTAYVLARYRFFGGRLFNSLIDLPFAIPTLVTSNILREAPNSPNYTINVDTATGAVTASPACSGL